LVISRDQGKRNLVLYSALHCCIVVAKAIKTLGSTILLQKNSPSVSGLFLGILNWVGVIKNVRGWKHAQSAKLNLKTKMGGVSSPNWWVFIPLGGGGVKISLLCVSVHLSDGSKNKNTKFGYN